MTYSILEAEHGDIVATYPSREEALRAAAEAVEREPAALTAICVVAFDDAGTPGEALYGAELREAVSACAA